MADEAAPPAEVKDALTRARDLMESAREEVHGYLEGVAATIEQAEQALNDARARVIKAEEDVTTAKAARLGAAKSASEVLTSEEIAQVLGLAAGTVANWLRDPNAPKRRRKAKESTDKADPAELQPSLT